MACTSNHLRCVFPGIFDIHRPLKIGLCTRICRPSYLFVTFDRVSQHSVSCTSCPKIQVSYLSSTLLRNNTYISSPQHNKMLPGQAMQIAGLVLILAGILFKLLFTLTARLQPHHPSDEESSYLETFHLDTDAHQPHRIRAKPQSDFEHNTVGGGVEHLPKSSKQKLIPFAFNPGSYTSRIDDDEALQMMIMI